MPAEPGGAVDLRLIVITDREMAAPADPVDVIAACLDAGAPAIQLRDKLASSRERYALATEIRALTTEYEALFFVNDRLDVALAAGADGVHLGPDDIPVDAARRAAPAQLLIGYSTDEPDDAVDAVASGADYIGCGAVFGTRSKEEAAGERIGVERLDAVARAVDVPVVGIGGVTQENVGRIASTAAAGAAVIRAVMASSDPAGAVKRLLEPFTRPRGG